ncbi:organic hydroperoxide resistance protein [Aestuariivirga sp.]|jgi:osmotically inducible protein OsmC|uniref:organic hydroperoxide resistance protein n=1 Tax=Aestuariivirga sp. TaxID=2650926 RepID=UPI003785140F
MPILYTAHATSTGGRDGRGKTDDGKLDVALSLPKEMGGDGKGTNPEQLFAVGYSACYLGAVKFVAGQEKVTIAPDAAVTAHVGVGPRDDGGGFGIAVTLDVKLPGLTKAQAEDITTKAHVVCPYSHATKGNIPVKTNIL